MATNTRKERHPQLGLLTVLLVLGPLNSHAAPGTLSYTPLFTTTAAEPNIFFMVDDSNSMNTELLTPEYISSWGGIMELSTDATTRNYKYVYGKGTSYSSYSLDNSLNNGDVIPTQAAVDGIAAIKDFVSMKGVWRARNNNYNKMYYDPTKTYSPWTGVNNLNVAYDDITDVTKTPIDPFTYNPSDSGTYLDITSNLTVETRRPRASSEGGGSVDLTFTFYPARYWVWAGSGTVVDATDTHTLIEIKSGTAVCANGTSATRAEQAAGSGCMLRSYAAEIKNFANWFAYHRRREFAAKYALSKVIGPATGVRMGIATIHNDASNERKEMASMNVDPSAGNKELLLDALFRMDTSPSTPLNSALKMAGEYFKCTGSGTPFGSSCAIEKTVVAPATEAAGICQQNFSVLVTDGDYTDSNSFADEDGNSTSWTDGGITYSFAGNPYADGYTGTLADIAMYYYERDLDGTLDNEVPTQCGVDENPAQHMVTYSVGFGVTGLIDPDVLPAHPKRGYASSCTDNTGSASAFTWSDPDAGSMGEGKIDDVLHAAFNGRGQYYSADDPEKLSSSLSSAVKSISDRTGSAAAVAFNSATLGTDSAVYLALFNSTKWSGDLLSYPLDPLTGDISASADWSAANGLDSRDLSDSASASPRIILTHNGTDGSAFQWDSLTTAQKTDLKTNPTGSSLAVNDAVGKARLKFLRGDRSCESGSTETCSVTAGSDTFSSQAFRSRNSRLGDIVHGGPVFVGAPELNWPDTAPFPDTTGNTYSEFHSSAASRTPVVYIGANDGMLHGFHADTGEEVLAYIPSNLFSDSTTEGLHYLTDPTYGHRFHVDLTPSVSDAFVKTSTGGSASWRTILIGGERGGGRALFALDVTDPADFSEANAANLVLWEFGSSDDADLGYTFSQPIIALLNNGKWAAIFGNGYNDTGSTGDAQLFIVYLEGGLDGTWTIDTDYKKITTEVGSTADRNGLATPAVVDLDGDGDADRVYAGDLQGNMWVFDLSSATAADWEVAYTSGSAPAPLFTAASSQPITTTPMVVRHPTVPYSSSPSNAPNLLILFGTGQYMVDGDKTSTDTQSFYGVWDKGDKERTRSHLVPQTFETGFAADIRVPTNTTVDYSSKYGWYMDLPTSGERVVTDSTVRGDIVYFNTTIPSVNPCAYGGSGWLMSVKAVNGGRPDSAVFDVDGVGGVDEDDLLSAGSLTNVAPGGKSFDQGLPTSPTFLGNKRYTPGTSTESGDEIPHDPVEALDGVNTGRLSWEELSW